MLEIKKLEKGMVEIKGEIGADVFESFRDKALKHLGEHVRVDGFRPGHIPANVVEKNVGEMAVLEEMAQMALSKSYPKILEDNKIDAIGYPQINITKLAKGNPLGYTITVATLPEIKLADYKSIAKDFNKEEIKVEVSEAEYESVLKNVKIMKQKEDAKPARPDGGHSGGGAEIPEDAPLPEIDDAYVKKLGGFENLADFKEKIMENIRSEKEFRAKDKRRLEIIEKIIEKTPIDVPEILINSEIAKMHSKMKSDIEGMGMKYEDYIKSLGKSEDEMKKDWRENAEKRAKLQLIVTEIAKTENIKASEEKVKEEVKKVMANYSDVDENNARAYIESVLENEEVMKFLEGQK